MLERVELTAKLLFLKFTKARVNTIFDSSYKLVIILNITFVYNNIKLRLFKLLNNILLPILEVIFIIDKS